jgi:hypothetical protein
VAQDLLGGLPVPTPKRREVLEILMSTMDESSDLCYSCSKLLRVAATLPMP